MYGFPSTLTQAFKRYEILTRKKEAEIMREAETRRVEQMSQAKCLTSPQDDELPISVPGLLDGNIPPPPVEGTEETATPLGGENDPKPKPTDDTATAAAPEATKEEKSEKTAAFNLSSDTYNGAVMENYRWSQTITDIDVRVPVPPGTTAKNVRVDIRSDYLKVVLCKPRRKVCVCVRVCVCVCVCMCMYVCVCVCVCA